MLTQSLLIAGLAALVAADKQNNPGYYGNSGGYGGGGSYSPQGWDGNSRYRQQNGGGYPNRFGGGGYPPNGPGYPDYNDPSTNQQQQQQQQNTGDPNSFFPTDRTTQQQQQQQQTTSSFSGGNTQKQQQQQQITLNINTAPTSSDPHYTKPDIHLNQLTPYSTECTQLGFDPDIDITMINIDIQQIQCQAFGDPQGQQPVGGIFGYDNPCDLGEQPVQVESILCSVPHGSDGGCGGQCN